MQPTTIVRRAECSCGQLSAVCTGEPAVVSVCHCLACKRRTGSAFGYGAYFREDQVVIAGTATEFVRIGDDGGRLSNFFCPICGASVFGRNSGMSGIVSVPVGTFADPAFPPPTLSVYHESRGCRWLEIRTDPLYKRG
jgi:hypothetical protein